MKGSVLITGGMGYIGSHTCVALARAGYQIIILDNLSNSHEYVLNRLSQIIGYTPNFILGDLRVRSTLDQTFADNQISAVIHFAGLKAVHESLKTPLKYYDNNIQGIISLLSVMEEYKVNSLIFSSSASVYGDSAIVPIREDFPCFPTNPYSRSKLYIENILRDIYQSKPEWNIALLRYFNPAGAHPSGLIGEDPKDPPSNLMPCISQVAIGQQEKLYIYGDDYPTLDGTGIRDYIHVMDLAEGHLSALQYIQNKGGMLTVNLGRGIGTSVLEVVQAYEAASSRQIPYQILPRRLGDVAQCWADPSLAATQLNWRATRGLSQMCEDSWRWQKNNQE